MVDQVDRRALAAFRFLDGVTGVPVIGRLSVLCPTAKTARTPSGLYAIVEAEGLENHLRAFQEPPSTPDIGSLSFQFTVTDPLGRYLPVTTSLDLPRDPDNRPNRPVDPVDVELPCAPSRMLEASWSGVRVSLADGEDAPLRGVVFEVHPPAGGTRLGWGLTDENGEGVAPIAGIPLLREVDEPPAAVPPGTTPAPTGTATPPPADAPTGPAPTQPSNVLDDSDVTSATTPVRLTAFVDPKTPWPTDPQKLMAGRAGLPSVTTTEDLELKSGVVVHQGLTIALN